MDPGSRASSGAAVPGELGYRRAPSMRGASGRADFGTVTVG
jgi:hypothetical protein